MHVSDATRPHSPPHPGRPLAPRRGLLVALLALPGLLALSAAPGIASARKPPPPPPPPPPPVAEAPQDEAPASESLDNFMASGEVAPAAADPTAASSADELSGWAEGLDSGAASAGADNFADVDELDLEALIDEPMVVTGGKRVQRLSTALSTITVITREDIEASPYLYLGEFLAGVPGLDVRWGMMQRLFVGARGLGGTSLNSRMLLLVDGQPMNDPFTGELNVGHFFPMVDVEQIEVIRGPGSTLYGANAFSGVVNVLTRNPFSSRRVSTLYGSDQTARVQGSIAQWLGPVNVGGSLEAFTTQGPFQPQYVERDPPIKVDNDDAQGVAGSAHASWEGVSVTGRFSMGERGRPGTFPTDHKGNILTCVSCHETGSPHGKGEKYPANGTSCGQCHMQVKDREAVLRAGAIASVDREIVRNLRVSANLFHNEWRNDYTVYPDVEFMRDKVAVKTGTAQRQTGSEIHLSHTLGRTNNVVFGVEGRRSEVSSSSMELPDRADTAEFYEGSAFAEDEVSPFRWLSLTAGGRLDTSTMFDLQLSPRVGVAVLPLDDLSLRASASRAFRNPNFAELYLLDTRGAYVVHGNPELEPETVTTYEARVHYTLRKPLLINLGANGYYSRADHLIGLRSTGLGDASFYNIEAVNIWGAELESELELKTDPNLKAFANYAFLDARDDVGDLLPYAPAHKVNVGLRARQGRFSASVRGRYVHTRLDNLGIELPPFATVDGMLGVHIWDGFGLQLWADNLNDAVYQESLGIPARRRSFFVSLYYDSAKAEQQ